MGQYYMVYAKNKDEVKVYDRSVNGEYTVAKLMEHSWWYNQFVGTFCNLIYENPTIVAWIGDYADESEVYDVVWGENTKTIGVLEDILLLDNKYLVNHTKKEYLDCSEYYNDCEFDGGWCIHPLPLLTCIGNGKGGGDYRSGTSMEFVGSWYLNEISVEDEVTSKYTKISPKFIED